MANPEKMCKFTGIPNELLSAFMQLHINGTQWRLIQVIIRKTYGWGKKEDAVALSQFKKHTGGLPRALISRELLSLEKRNIISAKSIKGKTKVYSVQEDYEQWVNYLPISRQSIEGLSTERTHTIYQSVDELSTKQRNTKEIKETLQKKITVAQEIYDYYAKTIKAGAKEDAVKSITKLLKSGISKEDLIGRINAYKKQLVAKPTDFIIQANNFFGEKARYKDFEVVKIINYGSADPNCKLCKGQGKYMIENTQEIKICGCRKLVD
jgi:phage replication O-like protein O